jgi:hypothetical protein
VNRPTIGGLACGLALLLAAACSSTGGKLSANGPFGNVDSNSGTNGLCARPGQFVHDGFEEFPNAGGTATLDKVTLVATRHLHLVAAWVLPTTGPLVDIGWGYPTASSLASAAPGVRWKLRQRIPGAVVRHTHGREVINLVILVKPSGRHATVKAVDLYYEVGGTHYLLHFPFGLDISVRSNCREAL